MLAYCAENADSLSAQYGNVTKASVGAIQRQLLQLESQGGDHFFGEPALDIHDMLKVDEKGRGYVNILAADRLMQRDRKRVGSGKGGAGSVDSVVRRNIKTKKQKKK